MTASEPRPWWASDPSGEHGSDDDPVVAHRSARRGGADTAASWWAEALSGVSELAEGLATAATHPPDHGDDGPEGGDPEGGDTEHDPTDDVDVCGVCPVCVGLRALQDSHPDLARHLTEAARHLAAAARELVDHPPAPGRRGDVDRDDVVEHIDLD